MKFIIMKKICFILVISGALLRSCSKDGVDRSIFIQDDEDARLPAYTEQGYNSFGAKYGNDYFLVSSRFVPCQIEYGNNQLHFSLHGTINGKEMRLVFIFPFESILDFKDLVQLNSEVIDLSDSDCVVKIIQENAETIPDVSNGKIHFKRAQLLKIDDRANRVILSGIFDVQFSQNALLSTISNGRFDLGIN